jgi:osmoprotectant transport system permease protein
MQMLLEMMNYLIESSQEFTTALSQHLYLTFVALTISIVLGMLAGIVGTRVRSLKGILLGLGNIGRTIPSLAVLAMALPFLGIGTPPTIFALVFIGTLPIMINTTVGIEQVDPAIKEAARGMGMNDLQVLTKVELPIASAVILAGIRTSAVVVVASATLAAFIGGGGLGDLILRGHALNRDYIMLAGAIPAILLAFYFEETFGRLESWATPRGLKSEEDARQSGGLLGLLAAVALLPLVFGMLLPWNDFMTPDGPLVLTGLHPEYRSVGVPVLILGLLAAMWPRARSGDRSWTAFIPAALAVSALLWLLINIPSLLATLQPGQTLQFGFYLQAGAIVLLAVITILELVRSRRESAASPAEAELVQEGGVVLG